MSTYGALVHHEQGGAKLTVESTGEIELQAGAVFDDSRWPGNVAVAGDALVIPVTHLHVSKTTAGDAEALSLANGTEGQIITISLVTDGGGDGTLTPATSTGWATAVFGVVGDSLTVRYIDDTVGWVIIGAWGTAVALTPLITL